MKTRRPLPPITVWVLGAIAACGIVALFMAAHAAFATVARHEQAIAAALLIEAGAVVEALTAARSGFKNKAADVGLAVSYLVSLSYNWTQVADKRPGLAPLQMLAFSAGPLSALTFVGLALGIELREYNERLEAWRAEGAAQALALAQRELDAKLALDAERQAAELKEARRARLHRQKMERAAQEAAQPANMPPDAGNMPPDAGNSPEWLTVTPEGKRHFVELVQSGALELPPTLTGAALAEAIPSIGSGRTGRDWLSSARNGHEDEP